MTTTTETTEGQDGQPCDGSEPICNQPASPEPATDDTSTNTDSEEGESREGESDGQAVAARVGDVVTDPVGSGADAAGAVAGEAVGVVLGGPLGVLDQAADDMAGTAFGDLAATSTEVGEPTLVEVGPMQAGVHVFAGLIAFAAIATTLLLSIITPWRRFGDRLLWAGGATARFLLVSAFGITVAVAGIEASQELTDQAMAMAAPEEIDTSEANVYTGALASVVVPVVGVLFDFQGWVLGVFVMLWPLAAAISITRTFRHALPIMTALIAANVAWPPLAALAIGESLASLPDISAATWWAVGAVGVAIITNLIALAARSST